MSRTTNRDTCSLPLPTSDGEFTAHYSLSGLCALDFPSGARWSKKPSDSKPPPAIRRWHALTTKALTRILAGQPPTDLPPLDFSSGTLFQQSVWRALVRIRYGGTRTYAQIAQDIARPKAVRAVGGACGANPIPVLVPCHRVLAANQALGGFSAGLHWKRTLLARERSWPAEQSKVVGVINVAQTTESALSPTGSRPARRADER